MKSLGALIRRFRRRKNQLALACGVVVLFGAVAVLQHWFVHRTVANRLTRQLRYWADEIAAEVYRSDHWQIQGYRQAMIAAPSWIIIETNGLLIDVEADIPSILGKVKPAPEAVFRSPQTVVSDVGESWRLFAKHVEGGAVILGVDHPENTASADTKLVKTVKRFGNTLKEALAVKSRQIDVDVDYAVVNDGGDLQTDWGGVPLRIDPELIARLSGRKLPIMIAGKPYLIHCHPIINPSGGPVGTVLVPQELSLEQEALTSVDRFNLGVMVLAGAITIGLAFYVVSRELLKMSRRGDLAPWAGRFLLGQPLSIEETRAYEFKEISAGRPADTIANVAEEYAVAFLNSEGGRIFWGVRDRDRVVVGVRLSAPDRDRLRRLVSNKLHAIQPQIDPTQYRLEVHNVESPGAADPDLTVIELVVPRVDPTEPYFTGGGEAFVRVDGVMKRLSGPPLVDWIRRRT